MYKHRSLLLYCLFIFVINAITTYAQNSYRYKKSIGPEFSFGIMNDIALDKEGYIYLADGNTIKKFSPAGKLTQEIELKRTNTNYQTAFSIKVDNNNNLYAVDRENHRIQKFDNTGNFLIQFGTYGTADGQFIDPFDVDIDLNNNIYVTDTKQNTVQKFTSDGNFLMKIGGPTSNLLTSPTEIALDDQGNIYVAEIITSTIKKFDSSGKYMFSIGNNSISPWVMSMTVHNSTVLIGMADHRIFKYTTNGAALGMIASEGNNNGQISSSEGIVMDEKDNIYIADRGNYRIQKLSSSGAFLMKISQQDTENGHISFPTNIVIDKNGNIYELEARNYRIQKLASNGKPLLQFGSQGTQAGQFRYAIRGLALDNEKNIYVVEGGSHCIHKFDSTGLFLTKFGTQGVGDGQFNNPIGIATDGQGNIYVVDMNNHRVQKFDKTGKFLLKIGSEGYGNGQFEYPGGVTIDGQGNIYVTDKNNHRVQKFSSSGQFLLTFGSFGKTEGQFILPDGIITDPQNNVYVVDSNNRRVQKFTSTGVFLTQFGKESMSKGNFYAPVSIALDASNDVYVTDEGLSRILVFTSEREKNYVTGKIFHDINRNCIQDNSEPGLPGVLIEATPGSFYTITDTVGKYSLVIDTGSYIVKQIIGNQNGILTKQICPSSEQGYAISFNTYNNNSTEKNFANTISSVPYLSGSVSSDRRRRCFSSTTVVSYSNSGYADAANVKVYVKLPKHVIFKSADKPYVIDKDSNYVFTIGALKANESGTIRITDSVACVANIRGLTACTKVWITPSNNYTLPPDSPWDQSDITLSGKCIENGRVRLVIHNTGKAMADSSAFRIYLDTKLAMQKNFRLMAGDSLVLRVPANGKTVRLEADQRQGHPRKSQSNLTIEGCVATTSDVVSKGFVDLLPQDDSEPEVAINCLPIIDSYDPNDKLVSPQGTKTDHYTPTNSELKYTIRFQNTGTDTAYTVVVVDTLSDNLDIATLQLGAASHKYSFNVSGKGRPVLTWTFANINLPDSTRDQKGSNGFVQFSIKPKAGLAEKARIDNFADIFFDYNEPVRTNTTTNVLYDLPPVVDNAVRLNEKEVVFLKPTIASFTPTQAGFGEQMTIKGTNYQLIATDNIVKINGMRATVVSASETELVVIVPQAVTGGKVSVTTLGGTAVSEVDFVLGSEQPQWSRAIQVYPNPSQGKFTVDLSGSVTVIDRMEVVNALGQKIVSQNVSKASLKQELDLSGHSAGFYLVVFHSQTGNATRKIIIR